MTDFEKWSWLWKDDYVSRRGIIDISNEFIQANKRIECLILSDRKVQPLFYCSIYKGLMKSPTGWIKMIL